MKNKIWIILLAIGAVVGIVWWWKSGQKAQTAKGDEVVASLSFVSADWATGQAQVDATIKGKKYPIGIQYNVDLKNVQIGKTDYVFGISNDTTSDAEITKVSLLTKEGKIVDEVTIDWVIQAGANTGVQPVDIEQNEQAPLDPTLVREYIR
jgi:hypothetical protein